MLVNTSGRFPENIFLSRIYFRGKGKGASFIYGWELTGVGRMTEIELLISRLEKLPALDQVQILISLGVVAWSEDGFPLIQSPPLHTEFPRRPAPAAS